MSEIITAERWLYETLSADAALMALCTGGVHAYPAALTAQLPFLLYADQALTDLMAMGGYRVWTDGVWVVRAVMETASWAGNLQLAADRIDALLHTAQGTTTGGIVWACQREAPFRLWEDNAGQQVRHLGGIYRIFVR